MMKKFYSHKMKAFKPSATKKTYLINKDGDILVIGVGEIRKGEKVQ